MTSIPSPPTHSLPATLHLPPLEVLTTLRSTTGDVLVLLEELLASLHPPAVPLPEALPSLETLLAKYRQVATALALVEHHLSAGAGGDAGRFLEGFLVHPAVAIGGDDATGGAGAGPAGEWMRALLSLDRMALPPPPAPPAEGTNLDHETRRQRALRACELLEARHDWRGRVGLVADDEEGEGAAEKKAEVVEESSESDDDDDDDDDDEGIFGSEPDDEEKAQRKEAKRLKKRKAEEEDGEEGKVKKAKVVEKELSREEREKELRRLTRLMLRGHP